MAIAADNSSDLFIDGKLVPGGSGRYPTINPATEEVLGTAADGEDRGHGAAPSTPRGAPSTPPTGPRTPNCGCAVSVSCAMR